MNKNTKIVIGVSGVSIIGILYYLRAKRKYQTDVITALQKDVQSVVNQVATNRPLPRPVVKPQPASAQSGQSGQSTTQSGQESPKPPVGQGYGVGGYGQELPKDQIFNQYGYGELNIGSGYEQGYGQQEYGVTEYADSEYEPPCKPTYGTGDWIMGQECLGK